jgi:hypothetical protein
MIRRSSRLCHRLPLRPLESRPLEASNGSEYAIDVLLIAAGPWAVEVAKSIGLDLCDDHVDAIACESQLSDIVLHGAFMIE